MAQRTPRTEEDFAAINGIGAAYLPAQSPAIVERYVTPDLAAFPGPRRYFQSAEARMVDLSFAGRQHESHPVLGAIAEARVGDPVKLAHKHDRWLLKDASGRSLGRMAKSFAPPSNTRFVRGEIAAILRWRKEDGEEEFYRAIRRDAWEVVIPEMVFEAL